MRKGPDDRRGPPPDWGNRANVLSMDKRVRKYEYAASKAAEGTRERKRASQETSGRAESG